jgi:hypothetical protein
MEKMEINFKAFEKSVGSLQLSLRKEVLGRTAQGAG